jgi:hypothetical protein
MSGDMFIFGFGFLVVVPVMSSVGLLIWFGGRKDP